MPDETSLGGVRRAFQPTLWTMVLCAKDPSAPDRRGALDQLIQIYWKPVYFFVRRSGKDIETSKDLTQGFFAAFLERDFLKSVQRERGRFRTFLLTTLKHYLADEHDRRIAAKRGGGRSPLSFDFKQAETEISLVPESSESPERLFQRQWALRVIQQALEALRREFQERDRSAEFETFRSFFSAEGEAAASYADIAVRLGISESDTKVRIHRARQRYRELIFEQVRASTETDEEAREELKELFAAFS